MTPKAGKFERGLLHTSVLIDLAVVPSARLPRLAAISAVTLAELSQGPHLTQDAAERAIRLERLQEVESTFPTPLPFDAAAARVYGSLVPLVMAAGRHPRPRRLDLMIAATAVIHQLPLFTRNAEDFLGLESRLQVVSL